jgi:ubiquinone/menaquinone biosynthesis C-methylase UbiE
MPDQITFDDGAGYERYMGVWSQRVGSQFLNWLAPQPALRWLDVGCGNGAFTELLLERCAPASVWGIDPSDAQLAFARARFAPDQAQFRQAGATALPFDDDAFDVAVMPLVIFFVPDPARGVAEMVRVVCAGGTVASYAWDMAGGGFPYHTLQSEMRDMGVVVPTPPSPDASELDIVRDLWSTAGLHEIETRIFTVERTFTDFDDYWATVQHAPSAGRQLTAMTADEIAHLQARMRALLPADASGRIACTARAHAVTGRVPTVG